MIIDAHTHLFPPEIVTDHHGYRARDPWFSEAFASPKVRFATAASLIESMDEAGVDQSIVVGWPWRDPGLCAEHNAYLAESAKNSEGRLHWLAIVNPVAPSAVNQVVDARNHGAVGVGELNADAQEYDWREDSKLQAFVESCIASELPVMIHASEPTGHIYPGKGTATPEKIVAFASAFPELNIVAAHWGGGLPFYELMPEVAAVLQNVAYDTSASTYLYRFDVFEIVTRIVGASRVVFGSDFPVLAMKRFVDRVRQTSLTDAEMDAMFRVNASRIYGIPISGAAI